MSVTFELLAQPQAKLSLFKVQKSDASIRPLFPKSGHIKVLGLQGDLSRVEV